MNTKTYIGIIDDYGLESFVDKKTDSFPFKLRASLNSQRNAIAYLVELTDKEKDIIDKVIVRRNWKKAGKLLMMNKTFKEL